ncbi:MAG TPA: [Fe-Fe] hydrogenase large subunit C-terminal domain-containing protein [Candidatus Cloacimonadota bacterium]|jgi:Fe-S-cluster-containing hydrogenase component 2|nr:[Fe-Fe] hydrogenase large subunit C-terminal domain-containing protein [Candidatus Cloacimonadales bacterium]HPY95799.1 [Fe-Fe] hydrogenase large subunit C-terminal domain-containing protein [Candidatus Cloacimonadota bacterium]HQB40502.1 [Fe-Fe] hydrogenase large subunit C-terminal domain-containing protein [Candidatus Cloacimonadota bacterium]
MIKKPYFHAINLINEKCKGCMHCVRICPTEALRIRDGRVHLDDARCVDCGKCIGVCPFGAIVATSDPLSMINDFKYKIAIISTPFAGQFTEDIEYSTTIKALYHLGFDKVIEESMATNIMTKMKRHYIDEHKNIRPILSSNCPAVIRLIQVRFPSLLPNIFHVEAPMSVLSMYYRDKFSKVQNLSPADIGIFLIVPCIAQVAAVHQPQGAYKRIQEGAIAIRDIYNLVRNDLSTIKYLDYDFITHEKGLSRALSGQEADEVGNNKIRTIAVSGIENVIEILQKVEDHLLDQYDYIVLRSCTSGCVGGILNVENPFIARSRIHSLIRNAQHHDHELDPIFSSYLNGEFDVLPLEPRSIMQLDKDMKQAILKMKKLNEIKEQLPLIDCGACGTPNCQALAEDIVQGKASIEDCVILLKKNKNKNDE